MSEEPDAKEPTAAEPDDSAKAPDERAKAAEASEASATTGASETTGTSETSAATGAGAATKATGGSETAAATETVAAEPAAVPPAERTDRSQWNWLLIVPIVIPLSTVLYNRTDPTLFGIPFFYWMQLAFVALGVTTTTIVYQATKRGGA